MLPKSERQKGTMSKNRLRYHLELRAFLGAMKIFQKEKMHLKAKKICFGTKKM